MSSTSSRVSKLASVGTFVIALASLPTAHARCFIDNRGRERCTLSLGARIGIAVASVVAFIAVIACLGLGRRRQMRRANMAYVTSQQNAYSGYGQPYGTQYPYGNGPAYDGSGAYGGGGYPPQQYAAPTGGGYAPPLGPPPAAAQSPPQYNGSTPFMTPKEPPYSHA